MRDYRKTGIVRMLLLAGGLVGGVIGISSFSKRLKGEIARRDVTVRQQVDRATLAAEQEEQKA